MNLQVSCVSGNCFPTIACKLKVHNSYAFMVTTWVIAIIHASISGGFVRELRGSSTFPISESSRYFKTFPASAHSQKYMSKSSTELDNFSIAARTSHLSISLGFNVNFFWRFFRSRKNVILFNTMLSAARSIVSFQTFFGDLLLSRVASHRCT